MSKKNFTGGLNSLLGDQPEKPKRGRPVTQSRYDVFPLRRELKRMRPEPRL